MEKATAIAATFSDYRTVKSRKVLQLIFEVPLEKSAEAFLVLGFPMPDDSSWVGIAKLDPKLMTPGQPKGEASSEQSRAAYAMKGGAEKAVTRASLLCKEMKFQRWLERHCAAKDIITEAEAGEEATAELLRACIGVSSRNEIASDPAACQRFLAVETQYKLDTKQMAEVR